MGKKQVAVLVLPTPRLGDDTTGQLECRYVTSSLTEVEVADRVRAFAIDEFEYSAASSANISKVLWHPMSEGGESLWILTSDGRLQYVLYCMILG